jgi:hypothetical protein
MMKNRKSRIVGVRLPIAKFEAIGKTGLTISEFIKQAVDLKLEQLGEA